MCGQEASFQGFRFSFYSLSFLAFDVGKFLSVLFAQWCVNSVCSYYLETITSLKDSALLLWDLKGHQESLSPKQFFKKGSLWRSRNFAGQHLERTHSKVF